MSNPPRRRGVASATAEYPIPPEQNGRLMYPWTTMDVGHSFLFPEHVTAECGAAQAYAASKKYGKKFTARKTADGCRCWRMS